MIADATGRTFSICDKMGTFLSVDDIAMRGTCNPANTWLGCFRLRAMRLPGTAARLEVDHVARRYFQQRGHRWRRGGELQNAPSAYQERGPRQRQEHRPNDRRLADRPAGHGSGGIPG